MIKKSLLAQIEQYLLIGLAFTLSFYRMIPVYFTGLLLLIFLINGGFGRIYRNMRGRYGIITIGYYLMLCIGMLYTAQFEAGIFDLQVKAALLVYPLLFSSIKLETKQIRELLRWFILGCIASSLYCLIFSTLRYIDTLNSYEFYYNQFSLFLHPSYFSLYINFCMFCVFLHMVYKSTDEHKSKPVKEILILIYFTIITVLLSSKMGMLTLIPVIFYGSLVWFLKTRSVLPSIVIFLLLSSIVGFSIRYSSHVNVRVQEAVESIEHKSTSLSSTNARMEVWKAGWDIIKESPFFGYGTGDVKHELLNVYQRKNQTHLIENSLNAHNQFIQTLIAIGLVGGVFFFLYLFYPMLHPNFFLNPLYLGFILLVVSNFMVESMLETQAGVIFYGFFNAFLFFNLNKLKSLF